MLVSYNAWHQYSHNYPGQQFLFIFFPAANTADDFSNSGKGKPDCSFVPISVIKIPAIHNIGRGGPNLPSLNKVQLLMHASGGSSQVYVPKNEETKEFEFVRYFLIPCNHNIGHTRISYCLNCTFSTE